MKIGLLSDTHSHIDERITKHLEGCDEIWHAGDIGSLEVTDELKKLAPLRAVFGNIDNSTIRTEFQRDHIFNLEGQTIWMTHVGGRPPKFAPGILTKLKEIRPNIFICGHSHILIAKRCPEFGNHTVRTLIRFVLTQNGVKDLEVIEIKRKSVYL